MMKGKRSIIKYGSIDLEVFMLPDGNYVFSQTQVGLAIEKRPSSLYEFLEGKSPEALPHKAFTFSEIDIEDNFGKVTPVPLKIAIAYWTYWANKGNTYAQALLAAGAPSCRVVTIFAWA